MKRSLHFLLIVMISIATSFLTSCGGSSSAPSLSNDNSQQQLLRTISGYVLDAVGNPIKGVSVNLAGDAAGSAVTSDDGGYTFSGLAMGSYTITPSQSGYTFLPAAHVNLDTTTSLATMNKNFSADVVLVSGQVTTVVTTGSAVPLQGVTVTAVPDNLSLLPVTVTSASDGTYVIGLKKDNSYVITYTLSGYNSVNYYYTVSARNNNLETVPMLKAPDQIIGLGGASGTIVNAFDGHAAPNLTLKLRLGVNATLDSQSPTVQTVTTDVDGLYTFSNVIPGIYTAEISGQITNQGESSPVDISTTYLTVIIIGGTTLDNQNFAVTGGIGSNQYRIVLTWGAAPRDLDSHLTGPVAVGDTTIAGGRFHTYFSNKQYSYNGLKYADLDLDDVSSYGPETTTIYRPTGGIYRFSVHNFSNESPFSTSGGKVRLYKGAALLASFNAPTRTATGNVWTVFELDSRTDIVTPKNTISTIANYSGIP